MFFLMRHGEASWDASLDFERELTPLGREQLAVLAYKHHSALCSITKIVCSPYLRTRQSAAIIADSLLGVEVVIDGQLTPNHSVKDALSAIEKHGCENVLVVTHQPLIGNLISYLEQGDLSYPEPVMPGSIYLYSMPWPGPGCGLREAVFLAYNLFSTGK